VKVINGFFGHHDSSQMRPSFRHVDEGGGVDADVEGEISDSEDEVSDLMSGALFGFVVIYDQTIIWRLDCILYHDLGASSREDQVAACGIEKERIRKGHRGKA